MDLESLLATRVKELQASGQLTTKPRSKPRCPQCHSEFVGKGFTTINTDEHASAFFCGECNYRLPPYIVENVSKYNQTYGFQRPRGRPKGRPRQFQNRKQMVVVVEGEKLQEFKEFCRQHGKTMNQTVREFMDECLSSTA